MGRSRRLPAILAAALALLAGRAAAEPAEPAAPRVDITLARAIADGARRGPAAVESATVRVAAADFARRPGAGLPVPPQVTVLAGARRPYNLPLGPEVAVTVQQEIATRGLGAARRRAAETLARAAASDVDRARLEGALAAALAWVDLLEAQGLLERRAAHVDDAARVARLTEIRAVGGVATATDRALAAAEVGAARLSVLDGEGRATEARLTLALAAGEPLGAPLRADGSLVTPAEPAEGAAAILARVGAHPALLTAEARAAHASAEIAVARATAGPLFSLGASVWREGSGDHAAAALVSLPLPLFDPARYDEGRQSTVAAAASAHAGRLRVDLEREVRLALHEREHTREVRAQLESGVAGPLRKALETAIASYAAGMVELSVVLIARRSLLAADERLVTANADVLRADVRVAALGGTLLRRSAP